MSINDEETIRLNGIVGSQKEDYDDASDTETSQPKGFFKVDMYMLPAKISYFFTAGQDSAFKPFMLPFLVGIGLNEAEAGLITGLRLLGMTFAGPLWGYITDRKKNYTFILNLLGIMSIILVGGQPVLSYWIGNTDKNKCPAVKHHNMSSIDVGKQPPTADFGSQLFLIFLVLNIVASCFDGCLISQVDGGVLRKINAAPQNEPKNFGWNRLFGGAGFALASLLSGIASDSFPTANVNCYTGAFVNYVVFVIFILISAPFLFRNTSNNTNAVVEASGKPVTKPSVSAELKKTLLNTNVIIFFATVVIMGLLQGIYISFTALHLKDLDAPIFLTGLTISIGALACLPFLIFGSRLIELFHGIWNTLGICCFSYAVRFISFGNISNPWLVIPINLLQSLGFGLFLLTAVLFIKSISKPEIYTTMYSLMNTMFYGVGFIIANICGGQIFSRYRGSTLFNGCGWLALGWTVVIFSHVAYLKFSKSKRRASRKEQPEKEKLEEF